MIIENIMPADDELDKAREHVARAAELIHRLEAVIEALEQSGKDTQVTRKLLYRCFDAIFRCSMTWIGWSWGCEFGDSLPTH